MSWLCWQWKPQLGLGLTKQAQGGGGLCLAKPQVLTDSSGFPSVSASEAGTLSEHGCHGSSPRGTVTVFFSSDCYLGSQAHSCYGCPWPSHSILGHPSAGTGEGERERIGVSLEMDSTPKSYTMTFNFTPQCSQS